MDWLVVPSQSGLSVAAKGGFNKEAHNQNDLGSVIVFSERGESFLADLGRGKSTRSYFIHDVRYEALEASSFGHNVPRINGHPQCYGESYRAVSAEPHEEHGWVSWSTDLAGAYPEEAGLDMLVRTLAVRTEDHARFELKDRFSFRGEKGFYESALYTYADNIDVNDGDVLLQFASGSALRLEYDSVCGRWRWKTPAGN